MSLVCRFSFEITNLNEEENKNVSNGSSRLMEYIFIEESRCKSLKSTLPAKLKPNKESFSFKSTNKIDVLDKIDIIHKIWFVHKIKKPNKTIDSLINYPQNKEQKEDNRLDF